MTHQLISPPGLATTAPYAYAALVAAGQLVFTAGACPLDSTGSTTPVGDLVGQCHQAVANLQTALEAAGADLADVVKTTIYVASDRREDLSAAWATITAYFTPQPPSTLVGVTVLGYPDQLVEVEAVAVVAPT
ncbi:RidA family protein [Cryptosporangium arvum]|uniref:RidA family protein n=1 Tax=Cryptosporangium arvum TaxID=80871 RepID=UPI0004B6492A|nr:RidA family protein [Cryptosporangium arvum]